jgi:PAS domain S-box-containing protein
LLSEDRFDGLRRIALGVAAALLLALLAWLTLSSRQSEHAEQAAQAQEVLTLSILRASEQVLGTAQDAETGERGFLLTGDPTFLQPLNAARERQPAAIARLRELTTNDPEAVAKVTRIEELALSSMAQLERNIVLQRQGRLDQAARLAHLRTAKQTMDQLRAELAALEQLKQLELLESRKQAQHSTMLAGRWRALLTAFTLLLAMLCAVAVLGQLRARREAREQAIRARSEHIMEAGRHLLQSIIDSSANLIFVKTRQGEVLFANAAFTKVVPIPFPMLHGVPLPPTDEPDEAEALAAADRAALERGEQSAVDLRLTVDGQRRWYRVEKNPWVRDGRIIGVIGIVRDISATKSREASLERRVAARTAELEDALASVQREMAEREAAQESLRQLQKIESLGQLTGGIAHDFNNMLTVVMASLDTARRKLAAGDAAALAPLIDTAMAGATSAADLTSRLLAFARQQKLEPVKVSINDLVTRTQSLLARALGSSITVQLDLDPAAGWVEVDNSQLESALVNLAVNSRDAMPQGGRLTITTRRSGETVQLLVQDTGEGIGPDELERVYDPFFTTKPVGLGTGLGLSQVHGFVAQSGGTIAIQSTLEVGTTVCIDLPACAAPDAAPASAIKATVRPARADLVLLVEDEAMVRLSAQSSLQALGYRVITAAEGYSALKLLEDNPEIVLLLTDVSMPGMDGHDLADAAQLLRPGLAVVFTTGNGQGCKARVGAPVLTKPYLLDDLALAVSTALDNSERPEPGTTSANSPGHGGGEQQTGPKQRQHTRPAG